MKMELNFESILDVALGGPEIGPLNLHVLHGLMKLVFEKFDISQKNIIIEEEDPYFSDAYNFIKSKVDEQDRRPRTAGGGYSKERSRVSVIVSDYVRSPVGQLAEDEKKSNLVPVDIEDRLRYIESELKIVKNFPSVDELRTWAQEKTSPDTVVTDLWHFVSLTHRVTGTEEGIQKLTELVDKLIPELKKSTDEQNRLQGQIDDLYSQMHGLSERLSRNEDTIDAKDNQIEQKVNDIRDEMKNLDEKLKDYAKLMDLEDFLLTETFVEEKDKARKLAEELQNEMESKMPLSMLDYLVDKGAMEKLEAEMELLKTQMNDVACKDDLPEFDSYVKWPQLEDALLNKSRPVSQISRRSDVQPELCRPVSQTGMHRDSIIKHSQSSSPGSRNSSRHGSLMGSRRESQIDTFGDKHEIDPQGSRPSSSRMSSRPSSGKTREVGHQDVSIPPISESRRRAGSLSSVNSEKRSSVSNIDLTGHSTVSERGKYPNEECIQKLRDLGRLADRQKAIMDALEATREQLEGKADRSELEGMLTQEDLNQLLNLLRDLREEVNGLQNLRDIISEEKVPALRALLSDLEQQVSDLLNKIAEVAEEQKVKQRSIDTLFTLADGLEERKLDKKDQLESFPLKNQELESIGSKSQDETDLGKDISDFVTHEPLNDEIERLKSMIEDVLSKLDDHEGECKKTMAGVIDDLENKLDRSELQPLREYLENRYNTLLKQSNDQALPTSQQNGYHQPQKHNTAPKPSNGYDDESRLSPPQSKQFKVPPYHSYTHPVAPPDQTYNNNDYLKDTPGYTLSKGNAPYYNYVMDDSQCSHPHYGDGGFVPKKKEAAAFRTQMKFNCLSCDRPLTMQTNSHLQTIRGRPLTAYELDQQRLLQRLLKGDNPGKANRACGGRHTSSAPNKRITARINSSMSLPARIRDEPNDAINNGGIDIEGLDGRLYRGLISQKDFMPHHRSKSANPQLRTVSPLPKSEKSGKSLDFGSSYNSELHGSFDIQIEE